MSDLEVLKWGVLGLLVWALVASTYVVIRDIHMRGHWASSHKLQASGFDLLITLQRAVLMKRNRSDDIGSEELPSLVDGYTRDQSDESGRLLHWDIAIYDWGEQFTGEGDGLLRYRWVVKNPARKTIMVGNSLTPDKAETAARDWVPRDVPVHVQHHREWSRADD